MKLSEAYTVMGLSPGATPEEAKKQFKKLAKEFHPDVNKAAGAEAKFKQINEAYQIVESGEGTDPPIGNPFHGSAGGYGPFRNPFSGDPFGSSKRQYYASNIDLNTTISFKESVQGVKKEIKYSRQIKCPHCQGSGNKPINNGCKKCGGRGQTTIRQGGAIFIQTCPECMGRSKTNPCTECNSAGVLSAEASVHVSIPPAVSEGNILRLSSMGNFSGTLLGLQDTYTDVYVHIHVTAEEGMRLEGKDIVSEVTISLLDALRGCSQKVKTISGEKKVTIEAQAKNKDEVVLSVGDHNSIKHRVIVNIGYPTNIDKLIDVLLEEGK